MPDSRRSPVAKLGALTILLIAIALPFVLGSLYMSYRTLWFKFAATKVDAIVVERSGDRASDFTVEYTAPNGLPLRTTSAGSDFYNDITTGQTVTLFYDPKQPTDARIDHFVENWIAPLITLFPALMLLIGAYFARAKPHPSHRRRPTRR